MARRDVLCCPTCGLTLEVDPPARGQRAECPRCGSIVSESPHGSLQVTAALAIAALILYIPANIYPILRMHFYGAYSESTVWDGVVSLAQTQQYFVALIVFMASIVVPILKLAGLLYLVISARFGMGRRLRSRTRIYRFIDVVGPWAMLDVFLLAILVALVKLGQIATVRPGPGLIAFTAVVVLTMLASASFDPRAIWERRR
ncbi:MAG TPA: paraquat-inducible protein A [Burkholderiales bacterium]|nr:paraquat-inducible protein A [Burkholderiales bacterium]